MPTVSTIQVLLTARTAGFEKAMQRGAGSITALGAAAAALPVALTGVGVAVAAAATAATAGMLAVANATRKAFGEMDEAGRLAQRLGVTTEALESWRFAARQAGDGTESFDRAIEDFAKRLGTQGDDISRTLKAIGLSQNELLNVGTEEAFLRTADAISAIANPSSRAAAAFELFGKQSRGIVSMMTGGRNVMDQFARDAERLGLTFSTIDASKVDAAGDAFAKIGELLTGIGRTVAVRLAPMIESVSTSFIEWATQGAGVTAKVIAGMEGVAEAIAVVSQWVDLLKSGWLTMKAVALGFAAEVGAGLSLLASAMETVNEWLGATSTAAARKEIEALEDWVGRVGVASWEAADEARAAFAEFEQGLRVERVRDFFKEIREQSERAAQVMASPFMGPPAPPIDFEAITAGTKELERLGQVAVRIAEQVQTPWEKYGDTMADIIETFAKGLIDQETFFRAIEKAEMDLAATQKQRETASLGRQVHRGFFDATPGDLIDSKREQTVRDPQLQQTNRILASINQRMGTGGTNVAVAG